MNAKIVFVLNAVIVGGAESHAVGLARSLAERGERCAIFAIRRGNIEPEGVSFTQAGAHEAYSLAARIRALARFLYVESPDLIICVNDRPLMLASLARLISGQKAKIVVVEHSSVFRNRKDALFDRLYRPFQNRADCVVFISENQRLLWLSRGVSPKASETILNGVDMTRFSPGARETFRADMRNALGFEPGDFVLGCCAVLRPEKNHAQLIDVIQRLAPRLPVKALIIGDGPMRRALVERARGLGIGDRVIFAGDQSDVRPFLAATDVGVLCSVAIETLSLAALETLAMGIPMLMTDIGGASEIVDGRNGALFSARDTARLVVLVEKFQAAENARALPMEIRAGVVEKFNHARMVSQYRDLFRSMMRRDDRSA